MLLRARWKNAAAILVFAACRLSAWPLQLLAANDSTRSRGSQVDREQNVPEPQVERRATHKAYRYHHEQSHQVRPPSDYRRELLACLLNSVSRIACGYKLYNFELLVR